SASPDLTGQELGDYQILRRIGVGGMAEVYLAEQRSLSRQVALKVLNHSLSTDASYVQRFQNEARAAASLVHPNIVQIYEVGHDNGFHFIAQEYVAGKNLGQILDREGAFQPALVLDILRQVVSALCKAHELAIVHRDIKPENILLSNSGEVKVADFGLARVQNTDTKTLTQVGVAMGTPLYMSPEQVEGRTVDVRSDIYSLGVSCYHLLAGVPPHTGDTALAIAVQHLHNTPEALENVRSDVPSAMSRIVHKMLAKKPAGRHAAPSDLLVELRELTQIAAQEGWATASEDWSMAEWIATEPARTRTGEELEQFMQAESRLQTSGRNWRRLAIGLAAAALLGVLLSAMARPRFYLAGGFRTLDDVPDMDSAWGQIYHAQMNSSEAAWQKAVNYSKDDNYMQGLARRGLVRHYLLVTEDYQEAVPVLLKLELQSQGNPAALNYSFALAGLSFAYDRLGDRELARTTRAKLQPGMLDQLSEEEPQIYGLLEATR
ncbi:MAG: serine/threonine-protein kinase, partial [Bythopirellula sp.]